MKQSETFVYEIGRPFKERRIKVPHVPFPLFIKYQLEELREKGVEYIKFGKMDGKKFIEITEKGEKIEALKIKFPNEDFSRVRTLDDFYDEWNELQSQIYF
jgi:hypothetical protein